MQSKLLILRKEKNVTQKQMAKLIDVTMKTYSAKERGEYPFDADEMFKISNFFKKNIQDIFLPRTFQNGNKTKTKGLK